MKSKFGWILIIFFVIFYNIMVFLFDDVFLNHWIAGVQVGCLIIIFLGRFKK